MNPRTVAHCPECGAPSLEEERRVLLERKQLLLERKRLLEMQEEAVECRECQAPVQPAPSFSRLMKDRAVGAYFFRTTSPT